MNRAWCLAVALMATPGCAPMSAGDCTDKGTCDPSEDAASADASVANADGGAAGADASMASADASMAQSDPDSAGTSDANSGSGRDATPLEDAAPVEDAMPVEDAAPLEDAASASAEGGSGGDCTCVEAPPAGWSGPVALAVATGAPPAGLGACLSPYGAAVLNGNANATAPAPTCACACGAPTGETCPSPTIGLYADSACSSSCGAAAPAAGLCATASLSACGASPHARGAPPTPQGGACQADASTSVPPATWGTVARACALAAPAPQGTCGGNEVCAPAPTPPYSGHLCVLIAGDAACPTPSSYSVRQVYYSGATDTRDCSSCTCGAPAGGTCGGTFSVYNTSACALFTSAFPLSSACAEVQIATSGVEAAVALATAGACAASPVGPVGGLAPSLPTTACCEP